MKIYTKNIKRSVISSVFIADALVYTLFIICLAVEFLLKIWINIENQTFDLILTLLIEALFLGGILKIKKIKNGISFLQNPIENEYLCIIMVAISVIAVFAYSLFGSSDEYLGSNIFIVIITSLILIIVMIQKTLTLYYKQKLLAQNIEEYKAEIASKDAEIKSLSEEKYKISKLNHEFYNRQKALIHKVEEIMNMNTEAAEELDLSKQINDLTKEYTDKAKEIKTLDKLPITGITEIDDMFKYMQSECIKNNIDFKLQINGNIRHLVNKIIPQDKLVTLIGDHIRDAIIAVNHSQNKFRSIVTVIEEKDKIYELRISDTGIEFEPKTLLKLGLEPATTHKEEGGTGIGFITTFETLKETKGTLIIEEKHPMKENDFTKTLIFRFDGKAEYKILTYRSEKIKDKTGRITIENIKK